MLTKHSDMESEKLSPGCSVGEAVRWMRCRRSCNDEGEMLDVQMRMDPDATYVSNFDRDVCDRIRKPTC
ncbi:hypothetical protein L1887_19830 [Cichorium endivia]|nr:hypothetical protein L1887_19830 [Cichorium endivia]